MVPSRNPQWKVFARSLEIWFNDYEVSNPILKFMVELANNRAKRIAFPIVSGNSIFLFRQVRYERLH